MITVVSPHPDDAELGASVFLRPGARILTITGNQGRMIEQVTAAERAEVPVIGLCLNEGTMTHDHHLVEMIEPMVRESTLVLSPPFADTHQDHRAVALAVRSALRRSPVALLEYETPSITAEWEPNVFVPMTGADLIRQAKILTAFKTQADRPYFSSQWLNARALCHGFRTGDLYAQAFRLVQTGTELPFPQETP